MDASTSALIVVAVISGVVGPGVLALLTTRAAAQARREDWARQDAVAARAKERDESNRVRLDQIHLLVNSNLTEALRRELFATEAMLVTMREVVDLKRRGGLAPDPASSAAIHATEERVGEMKRSLEAKIASTDAAARQRERAEHEAMREGVEG